MEFKTDPLVGALDQGTSSSRFLIFSSRTFEIVSMHQTPIASTYPEEGWVEQDPMEILRTSLLCIEKAMGMLLELDLDPGNVKAIGITNQRETTILWDKITGQPLYPAIVWQDNRTAEVFESLMATAQPPLAEQRIKELCGLPLSTYFSAPKVAWLIRHIPSVREAIKEGRCLFGTVDTWILWNWTKMNGIEPLHITDVTNASRTMLMNIATLTWDLELLNFFGVPKEILPEIRSSSEIYTHWSYGSYLKNVPISGILGDQQAALVGQCCLSYGSVKNTYGTGCFLLYNTGTEVTRSKHGLLTTVAYKLGPEAPAHYALEGSVAVGGSVISWLVNNVGIMGDESQTESVAKSVNDTGGCYFVPAFSGLYAPYWNPTARGTICGISHKTNKGHMIRAALEAIAFQTKEILDAMKLDTDFSVKSLNVDGGMATNKTLMQLQADIAGIDVLRHDMLENTALGAAMAAGNAKGIGLWSITDDYTRPYEATKFEPTISAKGRAPFLRQMGDRYVMWKKAIRRSLFWEGLEDKL